MLAHWPPQVDFVANSLAWQTPDASKGIKPLDWRIFQGFKRSDIGLRVQILELLSLGFGARSEKVVVRE